MKRRSATVASSVQRRPRTASSTAARASGTSMPGAVMPFEHQLGGQSRILVMAEQICVAGPVEGEAAGTRPIQHFSMISPMPF